LRERDADVVETDRRHAASHGHPIVLQKADQARVDRPEPIDSDTKEVTVVPKKNWARRDNCCADAAAHHGDAEPESPDPC
jgi:hypothetical protein